MKEILLDTHTWAWSMILDEKLSNTARRQISEAHVVSLSPISIYEISQKVRLGKWPEMAHHLNLLDYAIERLGLREAAFGFDVCAHAGALDWPHRDPFDRIIAATCELTGAALISADTVFDTLPTVRRVW